MHFFRVEDTIKAVQSAGRGRNRERIRVSSMKKMFSKRRLKLADINRSALENPEAFIEEENQRYSDGVEGLARALAVGLRDRCLVMLSGPSSSGKTTTAVLLTEELRELGLDAHKVSLDDFYCGRGRAPRLEDGSYDYEALEALDLPRLQRCMRQLLEEGRTRLPIFDFMKGRPAEETRLLETGHDSGVIFEGIHALNPVFEEHLPAENLYKVFINTLSPIYDEGEKLLARRELRLVRRLLRDERFRNSPVEETLAMWPQVTRGENLYMFPYVDTVDTVLDTTHAYEPCVFAAELLPLLEAVPADSPFAQRAESLAAALRRFQPLPPERVPQRSLLREFLGGGVV